MKYFIALSLLFSFSFSIQSQMTIDGEIKYGNEWIDYDKTYIKLELAEDRIYKVTYQELVDQGISSSTLIGKDIQVIHLGEPTAIFTTSEGLWTPSDYLLFYGEKNDVSIDKHLYTDWSNQMLNTEYSLFNDDAAYFLTINPETNNPRYTEATNDLSGNLPLAEDAYMHRALQVFSDSHYKPVIQDVKYSNFVETEGFGTRPKLSTEINFEIKNQVSSEGNTTVEIRSGSNNPVSTIHNITLTLNGEAIKTDSYTQNRVKFYKEEISTDALTNSTKLVIAGAAGSNTNLTVPYAAITYPRSFDFDNTDYWEFSLASSFFDRYIEIENFNGGSIPLLFNITTQKFQTGVIEDGFTKFKISPQTEEAQFVIINESTATKSVKNISTRNFIDYSQVSPDYMILTSQSLNNDDGGSNVVAEYAQYRSTTLGGGYDTYVVNIEDIYDQFAYGIDRHNIAPRNFAHYADIIWPNLEYWFNVGKGLEYNLVRSEDQLEANKNADNVCTFGAPGSDALMLSDLGEANPLFFFGRIAVSNKSELQEYFEKVKQHDDLSSWEQTVEGKLWSKEMIHLSGGDANIQESIFSSLESMRLSIENNKFGAKVNTIRKYSSDPIQTSQSQEVLNLINNGVSIITFFGHSAVGTFDFSLEDPSQYDNTGKYPMIISLGCLSGNVHTTARGLSEDFVLEPQKGSIAFLAASGTAYVNTQARSGKLFYDLLGGDYYGGTIGEIIKELYEDTANNTSVATRTLMQQLTLHGDPALKINPHEGSDYTVDKSSVSTSPSVVSTNIASFDLNFNVVNIGLAANDSLGILIKHFGPSGEVFQEKALNIKAPLYSQQVTVTLNTPTISEIGKNSIEIIVDSNDAIVELPNPSAENNNRLTELTNGTGYCFFVLDNGIIPVYPADFAIVNQECPFELKASTNNAFLEEQTYLFEIDTTELFNSPLLEQGQVSARGGLVTYVPNIPKVENQVYYWRVSPPSSDIGYLWSGSSFIYLSDGEEGWNQSHYYQFLKNDLNTLKVNEEREWEFANEVIDLRFDLGLETETKKWVYVNGVAWGSINANNLGSYISVFITYPSSLLFFNNKINDYSILPTSVNNFGYRLDTPEDRKKFMDLLDNVPTGARVFIHTILTSAEADWHVEDWKSDTDIFGYNIFDKLEENYITGASILNDAGNVPFLIAFEKNKEKILEEYGSDINSTIETSSFGLWSFTEGKATTTIIEKSVNWDKIIWQVSDKEEQDSIYMNIYGIDQQGVRSLIIERQNLSEISLSDLNEISLNSIEIEVNVKDETNRTSPQIDFIKVLYKQAPDIALNTNSDSFVFHSDTLDQGELLKLELPLVNYTKSPMGKSKIKFVITNELNEEIAEEIEVPNIEGMSEKNISWTLDTRELSGSYLWTVEYNPSQSPIEQKYFNNFGVNGFIVKKDSENPIIDVTFDGLHIANGDIVSSKPQIVFSSIDNNEYLQLDNSELFEMALQYPDGTIWNIPMSDNSILFSPPNNQEENRAEITFTPELEQDGLYTLTVQAQDVSGNFSGDNSYEVEFEVSNKRAISNVLNYPNPFSTSTQFVFTVTGDTAPEAMMINIYTVSGKLIKQITPDELGPVHVGHNRTNYRWTGEDEYGQKLANGVYLYRVIYDEFTQNEFETYFTESDSYFKNGFGKMVIMR